MQTKKLILLLAVILLCTNRTPAETLQEVEYPKPPAYRVGISEIPENQYIQAKQEKLNVDKIHNKIGGGDDVSAADLTYADLSIKRLSNEIAQDLEYDEQDMIADLSLLWQGAAVQSDTINFALYKLANPDADKPDEKSLKKVLTTIASMSTLVGASMSSPILAGSSLIGGNILNIMSQDTKALNYKYTRVTDADMIILVRKIEDLQQNAVNLYYDYMSSKKQLDMITKLVNERKKKFELAQKNNAQRELVVISDAYYRTAIDKQRTLKSDFFAKRAALEQFVGNETFVQFEQELTARENGEKPPLKTSPETEEEYNETVQNVENYTNSLKNEEDTPQSQTSDIAEDEQNTISEDIKDTEDIEVIKENSVEKSSERKINFTSKKKKVKQDTLMPLEPVVQTDETKTKNKSKSADKNMDFLPLDEIEAPDIDFDGYSIQLPEYDY